MTASPASALQLLLEREEEQRNAAEAALQQALERRRTVAAQVDQLVAYRADYQQRWSSRFAAGGTVALLQCYQGFMARLEQAIDAQRREQQRADARADACREALVAQQVRVAALQRLLERRDEARQRDDDRREQKATDEAASRTLRAAAAGTAEHGGLPRHAEGAHP